jgi:flagellar biogenesis protein FliO
MPTSEWSATESLALAFNIVVIGFIIWALRRKIRSKLNEVEERQKRALERSIYPEDDNSE